MNILILSTFLSKLYSTPSMEIINFLYAIPTMFILCMGCINEFITYLAIKYMKYFRNGQLSPPALSFPFYNLG